MLQGSRIGNFSCRMAHSCSPSCFTVAMGAGPQLTLAIYTTRSVAQVCIFRFLQQANSSQILNCLCPGLDAACPPNSGEKKVWTALGGVFVKRPDNVMDAISLQGREDTLSNGEATDKSSARQLQCWPTTRSFCIVLTIAHCCFRATGRGADAGQWAGSRKRERAAHGGVPLLAFWSL